jgi:hypothetical protein
LTTRSKTSKVFAKFKLRADRDDDDDDDDDDTVCGVCGGDLRGDCAFELDDDADNDDR